VIFDRFRNTPDNASCMGKRCPKKHNQNSLIRFSLTLWFLRGAQDPIPSRTRPSNSSAPMVLSLKAWESRSLQGLPKTYDLVTMSKENFQKPLTGNGEGFLRLAPFAGRQSELLPASLQPSAVLSGPVAMTAALERPWGTGGAAHAGRWMVGRQACPYCRRGHASRNRGSPAQLARSCSPG
jgi:hypothetical protein